MGYLAALALGGILGCIIMVVLLMPRQRRAEQQAQKAAEDFERNRRFSESLSAAQLALADAKKLFELHSQTADAAAKARNDGLEGRSAGLDKLERELRTRVVTLQDLERENIMLKRDLQNIDVHLNKIKMDSEGQTQRQQHLDERSTALAKRYLAENVKAIGNAISANNFTACKDRLLDVINRVREIGFEVGVKEEQSLISDLKIEFERAVKLAFDREEQARIRAQIREEEQLEREIDRELKQLERERVAIQAALDRALAEANGKHNDEVDRLKTRLAEAKSERALSMAQQTKAGYVYVISNIGSFGIGVFKVGMTRRLDPLDRVHELGDASVPFPFDVHMMIKCDDAPALENALHRAIHESRMNKVNLRKEFFKTDIETILKVTRQHNCQAEYIAEPQALEYRQSLTMTAADAAYIEKVHENAERPSLTVEED